MTKAKRHKYYKEALVFIKNDFGAGICQTLDWVSLFACPLDEYAVHWPEFYSQRPPDKKCHRPYAWFPFNQKGQKKRIKILEKCIALTVPKKKERK